MNGSAKSKSDLSSAGRKTADNIYEDNNHTSAIKKVQTINPGADVTTHKVKSGKRRRGSGRLPMVLIVTTIIFTIAISLSVLIISVGRDMLAIGKSDDLKIVTIPEGADTEDVAQILYDEGIIKIPKAFVFISKLGGSDTKYIAGEHELSPSNAYETIINELTTDKSLEKERQTLHLSRVRILFQPRKSLKRPASATRKDLFITLMPAIMALILKSTFQHQPRRSLIEWKGICFPIPIRFMSIRIRR